MRDRRGLHIVVRIVGSRALGIFFPHTIGSSTRIGVCPVVIGADIVGAGCVGLAATAAITMRLRGRAAASARPPPAVRAQHSKEFPKDSGPMAGTRAWLAWVVGMTILCHSSQIMLTEYPPAPASSTVPLPVLSTPTHLGRGCVQGPEESARKRRRRCSGRRSHRRGFTALAKYGPRLAAADRDAHWGRRRRHRP